MTGISRPLSFLVMNWRGRRRTMKNLFMSEISRRQRKDPKENVEHVSLNPNLVVVPSTYKQAERLSAMGDRDFSGQGRGMHRETDAFPHIGRRPPTADGNYIFTAPTIT
jgi:hypothetical protein